MRTSQKAAGIITTIGIDLGKNTFHLIGFDQRGAIVLRQKISRGQLERRLANIPRCLSANTLSRHGGCGLVPAISAVIRSQRIASRKQREAAMICISPLALLSCPVQGQGTLVRPWVSCHRAERLLPGPQRLAPCVSAVRCSSSS
jgi:hypothetical protein